MRSLLAVAVTAIAAVASVASLDEASPPVTSTDDTFAEQSAVLGDTSPRSVFTVHVTATGGGGDVTLTIQLTARWMGASDAGAGDAGPPDDPIVEATLVGAGAGTALDAGTTLDRAITMAPGTGALILSATAPCAGVEAGACGVDFTFTLDRVERVRSGPVSVAWTPVASVTSDTAETLQITVSP